MTSQSQWQPQQGQLRELAGYLVESLNGSDINRQKNAELMIKRAKSSPDIDNYLCFLTTSAKDPDALGMTSASLYSARSSASIMLKNDIKQKYKSIPEATRAYIQGTILQGLSDESPQIRNYTGIAIAELVRQAGILGWPGFLPTLLDLIDGKTSSPKTQEGASSALQKVCEDNRKALSRTYQSQCPLDVLIPKLLEFTAHESKVVKANALSSLDVFVPEKSPAVMRGLDTLLSRLFNLSSDQDENLRKRICQSLLHVAEVSPTRLLPYMESLVDYMIQQQTSADGVDDEDLPLSAADFFLYASGNDHLQRALEPYLPKLVPVLLESMIYQEEDVLRLEEEAEDAEQEDREQDIRPRFATSRGGHNMTAPEANGINGNTKLEYAEEDLSEGELEEYEEGDEDDPEAQWNLRKCSAATLDVLAGVYNSKVFENTLPYLRNNLTHADWPNREAAVLALGAIADGCMEVIEPHLPELIRFLITNLNDSQPIVRQITCWSLGRYSAWASHLEEQGKQEFFLPMMDGILQRMLDGNKRVQEAAASAFANLEEKANQQLENPEYCAVIVSQFAKCFARYKDRNMFILYDCVQTLAEHVGPSLQDPKLVGTLMPPILRRWDRVSDRSREMFPLLECLSYVAGALGPSFTPYAVPIFRRCIGIIFTNLQDSLAAAQNPGFEEPDPDYLITSLDLLSAIIQALSQPTNSAATDPDQLVRQTEPSIYDMMIFCLENPNADVRQSAYALLGDCAMYVYPSLEPYLSKIMPILIQQLDLNTLPNGNEEQPFAVTNNACWSCGEISMRARTGMAPHVETLLQNMYAILMSERVPNALRENAAIAMGRLAISSAQMLAPHSANFVPMLLSNMKNISATGEKVQAMQGLAEVACHNPQALEHCFLELIGQIADISAGPYQMGSEEHTAFKNVLMAYKGLVSDFDQTLQGLGPENVQILKISYGV